MKKWKISGRNLKDLYIMASCFDEAIEEARKTNRNYNGGQIVEY